MELADMSTKNVRLLDGSSYGAPPPTGNVPVHGYACANNDANVTSVSKPRPGLL